MDQVINSVFGFENPIDIPAVKAECQRTLIRFHPRLRCLLVTDKKGREHWRPAPAFDMDDHVLVVPEEDDDGSESYVSDYVAALTVSTPLSMEKPLWKMHILPSRRCIVLRLHHALGDGVSLMSLFLASCERTDDPSLPVTIPGDGPRGKKAPLTALSLVALLWRALKVAFFTFFFVVNFLLHAAWEKDEPNPISGGAGVELWPRKLVTVTFDLDDIKTVKARLNGTINDVLVGIIASGLAKYFKLSSSKESKSNLGITGVAMVNTRETHGLQDFFRKIKEGKSEWGNRFGFVLLPICLHKSVRNPLEYIHQAKALLGRKKQSLEAHFAYHSGALIMSIFGPKVATLLNYRILCNTSFTLSNVVGPSEEIMFAKNPITYIRATSNGLPHALIIHMISYNGKADLQLLVAKDIIHDPETLAKCFEDTLKEMKLLSITKI
ncbi:unnamed protein product [Spirodela intermedia]|uniref:Uncharacterized protein n=1 Tax=Spirodela intermedia TaxID=51605 RepID=A0A7I8JL81_SPIIN|nr:unnamed protein product [Spirodela intermedia]CAA6670511.1 unnamed protein product [Spirodela intermedia]